MRHDAGQRHNGPGRWLFRRCGQSVLEYSILVAIVAAAFLAMNTYVRRAVQGRITAFDDEISGKANTSEWAGMGSSGGASSAGSGPGYWLW
jgi:Flp pilus assembly pilin Flp